MKIMAYVLSRKVRELFRVTVLMIIWIDKNYLDQHLIRFMSILIAKIELKEG